MASPSLPPHPLPEHPRDSLVFTLARFVGTLVFISSLTLLVILLLLLKSVLIHVCGTFVGLAGVAVGAGGAVLGFAGQYSRFSGDGGTMVWGLLGGLDM